jgi:hypothetical protein
MPTAIASFVNEDHRDLGASSLEGGVSRAALRRAFSGALLGHSTAELQTCVTGELRFGYVGTDRFEGELDGRRGGFLIQHGGRRTGERLDTFGFIVPGSGTGDLAGISGDFEITGATAEAHEVRLVYTLGGA